MAEKGPALCQRASPRAIREQAEVANAHEAARHHVQEKASQEFVGLEHHDLHAIVVGVVLPAKLDAAVAVIDEAIIRQCYAVSVATEVRQSLFVWASALEPCYATPCCFMEAWKRLAISAGETSSLCEAIDHTCPKGSTSVPDRSP